MQIREFVEADWSAVWPIVRDAVQAQETFPLHVMYRRSERKHRDRQRLLIDT